MALLLTVLRMRRRDRLLLPLYSLSKFSKKNKSGKRRRGETFWRRERM